jgi:hypothetical protein
MTGNAVACPRQILPALYLRRLGLGEGRKDATSDSHRQNTPH